MNNRNPDSPWNPANSVQVTPKEYEIQVVEWISCLGADLSEFRVEHLAHLPGTGGEYEIDAVAEFSIFQGARVVVLIECKRYNRPVEREVILSLYSKLHDVGAHKAMIFSTSGFQKGALEYAAAHGIATITFIDGKSTYETRAMSSQPVEPPPWIYFPKYSGLFLNYEDNRLYTSVIKEDRLETIQAWLRRDASIA
jgi:restriction system protein